MEEDELGPCAGSKVYGIGDDERRATLLDCPTHGTSITFDGSEMSKLLAMQIGMSWVAGRIAVIPEDTIEVAIRAVEGHAHRN